jgi:hypothetical protein
VKILASGPLWGLAGLILGAVLTVAVLGRYHQFGKSAFEFTIMDRFTGKVYHCQLDLCEVMPMKEE